TNRSLKLFAQMAELEPLDGAKSKIRNSLRTLRRHGELKCWGQREVVVELLWGMRGQAKRGQHPFSRGTDIVQDVDERNKQGAARQHNCFHAHRPETMRCSLSRLPKITQIVAIRNRIGKP